MATNAPRSLQIYDPVLTGLARRYKSGGFIGDSLLAQIPVQTLSAQYPVFTKEYWFANDVDNLQVDRAPAKEIDFEWSTESFLAREYALKVSITDLERAQANGALYLERTKTELLTQRMTLAHEVRVATLLQDSADGGGLTAGNSSTPSNAWDTGSGNPEADLKTGALAIYNATGLHPNTLVISYPVAYALAVNTNFRALLRYDAAGQARDFISLGEQVLPSTIHGMRVVIPTGAQVDAVREGGSGTSISEIWGKSARLLYVDPSAGWGMPSVAYKFNHTPKRVTRWRETDPDIDYVREMERYDLRCVAPDTGYVLKGVIS